MREIKGSNELLIVDDGKGKNDEKKDLRFHVGLMTLLSEIYFTYENKKYQ